MIRGLSSTTGNDIKQSRAFGVRLSTLETSSSSHRHQRRKHSALTHAISLCGKILKVVAGQGIEAIILQIHQDVLSRSSEFFKRIVKPEWAQMREDPDTIEMGPNHSAEEVKTYAHWLYAGTIPTREADDIRGTKSDPIWIDLVSNSIAIDYRKTMC